MFLLFAFVLVPPLCGDVVLSGANAEVVVDRRAAPVVRFAGAELTNFLSRAFGSPVPLMATPTPGKTSLVLGGGVDVSQFARDEFAIRARGGRVLIAGRDSPTRDPAVEIARGSVSGQYYERATLFGAYEFLERFVGCRFYFPGELGEVVPRRESVAVPDCDLRVRPDMMARRVYSGNLCDGEWFDPSVKRTSGKSINWLRLRLETENHPCCHGLNHFKYVDRFGRTHPEYFALLSNGRRNNAMKTGGHEGQLCLTSGICEEIYRDVRSYLAGDPPSTRGLKAWGPNCVDGRYVDIMCQDGMFQCRCAACQAAYARSRERYGRDGDYADNWATELVWSNTCAIARRLAAEGVKGTVTQMAYYPYRHVPRMEIPANVDVMVAEHGPWSVVRPESMRRQIAEIRAWSEKLGRPVWIWTYPGKYGSQRYPGVPHMTPKCIGTFYKAASPYIFGSFMESESDRFLYNYLNYYVVSKVFWNAGVDVDALLDEHYRLMFGAASGEVKAFFESLEERWTREVLGRTEETALGPVATRASARRLWGEIYSPETLAGYDALLARAAAKTSPGSLEARRVALVRREFLEPLAKQASDYRAHRAEVAALRWRATEEPDGALLVSVPLARKPPFPPPSPPTRVWAKRTDASLVFTIDCEEPRLDHAVAAPRAHDDPEVWRDNDVELLLNVSGDRQTYYHFMVNSAGSMSDFVCVKAGLGYPQNDASWESGASCEVARRADGWRVRLEIPRAAFREPVRDAFPMEIVRSRVLDDSAAYYKWSPYSRLVSDVEEFGTVDFGR